MRYAITGDTGSPAFRRFVDALGEELAGRGYVRAGADPAADLVVNMIDADDPKPFRRRSRGTFVAAVHELERIPDDILKTNYPLLVRALANIVLLLRPGQAASGSRPWSAATTASRPRTPAPLARGVAERLVPLATLEARDRQRVPAPTSSRSCGTVTRSPKESARPARASATSTSCPRRSRSRSCWTSAICGTSSGSTASAASPTGTSPRARTSDGSG